MSRSRKKKPIMHYTNADSEKEDKKIHSRAFRRINKQILNKESEDELKEAKEVSNIWNWAKDGSRHWVSPYEYGDEEWFPKVQRK